VALGIVAVSILAALMAWRASVWSERSANTDEISRQDVVQQQQVFASHAQSVNQDLRIFGRYEEHSILARELERDAARAGGEQAGALRVEAQRQRAQAQALRRFFLASQPIEEREGGGVEYDPRFALTVLQTNDNDLETLRPRQLREEAREAHIKSVRLTGLAALFVVALVCLTLAEITRQGISRGFAAAGVVVMAVALGLFLFAL
jgi:hypothetical protein